jgi:hypothetical protein
MRALCAAMVAEEGEGGGIGRDGKPRMVRKEKIVEMRRLIKERVQQFYE